ncbi:hypothetical protein H4R19_002647 [Coemansia spiralis]|nr:hypothetical protein H4R19_002647 [Coemansia spiralis]
MAQLAWLKHQESTNPVPHANRPWSQDDLAQLQQLATGYRDAPVDWRAVGKQLGKHGPACITMYHALKRPPPARLRHKPTYPASLEVQRQLARGSGVDWEQVSRAAGLDVRQCLEISQVDEGKGRWIYDPDTFSWAAAERMKAFIADNYPAPTTANFRAVSNYMWLDMDDCIRMDGVLRGEMEWTDELKAQITEMRRLGMTCKDIGLHLSPCINPKMRAFMCDEDWRKDELRTVVFWFIAAGSLGLGCFFGLLGLRGFPCLAAYGAALVAGPPAYWTGFLGVDENDFGGKMEILNDSIGSGAAVFILAWTGVFTALHA